jgi:dTDP-4-amino-4,6-dideoxygalactose transaminase
MKKTIDELAILGGQPEFSQPLYVSRPYLGNREKFLGRVNTILDSGYLTNNGPNVRELERRLADMLKIEHVVAVCNGTMALELTIRALELKGEVIVPSLTFVATAHALTLQGIKPVFCDVDPLSLNIDPRLVEKAITDRTTGILGVHLFGRPCAVEELEAISRHYSLPLFFDAAHAFACSHRNQMIGNFGRAETFSFHATKFFHTIEGGAVATSDSQLADRIRLLRNFGFSGLDHVVSIGTNAKLNEISAAMGLTLLDDIDEIVSINQNNYELYDKELANMPGISLIKFDPQNKNNYQYTVVEINPDIFGFSRDQLNDVLWAENILSRRYFFPGVHRMEPYRTLYPENVGTLPETEKLVDRLLTLPNGAGITQSQIKATCDIIHLCADNIEEIKRRNYH